MIRLRLSPEGQDDCFQICSFLSTRDNDSSGVLRQLYNLSKVVDNNTWAAKRKDSTPTQLQLLSIVLFCSFFPTLIDTHIMAPEWHPSKEPDRALLLLECSIPSHGWRGRSDLIVMLLPSNVLVAPPPRGLSWLLPPYHQLPSPNPSLSLKR